MALRRYLDPADPFDEVELQTVLAAAPGRRMTTRTRSVSGWLGFGLIAFLLILLFLSLSRQPLQSLRVMASATEMLGASWH